MVSRPDENRAGPRRCCRGGPRRGSARALLIIPGISRHSSVPHISPSKCPKRQFCHEYGTRLLQLLDDGRIFIDHLILVWGGAPCRPIRFRREQILYAIWNAVQRPAVFSCPNLPIRAPRLLHRPFFSQCYHTLELRAIFFQPAKIRTCQFHRCYLACPYKFGKLPNRQKCQIIQIRRPTYFPLFARPERLSCFFEVKSDGNRIERHRRRNIIDETNSPEFFVAVRLLIEILKHRISFSFREFEPKYGFCRCDRFFCYRLLRILAINSEDNKSKKDRRLGDFHKRVPFGSGFWCRIVKLRTKKAMGNQVHNQRDNGSRKHPPSRRGRLSESHGRGDPTKKCDNRLIVGKIASHRPSGPGDTK